jgi:hypothetical protein
MVLVVHPFVFTLLIVEHYCNPAWIARLLRELKSPYHGIRIQAKASFSPGC